MKTSAGNVTNKHHQPIFLGRVSKPHVFSKMIHSHGAALKDENHKSVVPHQILHPDYDPKSPKLRVDYRNDCGSVYSRSQSRTSDLSDNSSTANAIQSLPQRKPYLPRAERSLRCSNDSQCSQEGGTQEIEYGEGERLTIMELERILIEEKTKLKKLKLETDAVSHCTIIDSSSCINKIRFCLYFNRAERYIRKQRRK